MLVVLRFGSRLPFCSSDRQTGRGAAQMRHVLLPSCSRALSSHPKAEDRLLPPDSLKCRPAASCPRVDSGVAPGRWGGALCSTPETKRASRVDYTWIEKNLVT